MLATEEQTRECLGAGDLSDGDCLSNRSSSGVHAGDRRHSLRAGSSQVQAAAAGVWRRASLNEQLCPGDVIHVGDRSRAEVTVVNQPNVRREQNTALRVPDSGDQPLMVKLLYGAACFFRPPSAPADRRYAIRRCRGGGQRVPGPDRGGAARTASPDRRSAGPPASAPGRGG